jgi:hypothetical protein
MSCVAPGLSATLRTRVPTDRDHIDKLNQLLRDLEAQKLETQRLIAKITAQLKAARVRVEPGRVERRRLPRPKADG